MSEEETEDGLVWEELGSELKGLFKVRNPWWKRLKSFLVILAMSCLPTFFDMGSDTWSVFNFINGTIYTKHVPDFDHPSVNSSQCTYVGPDLMTSNNSSSDNSSSNLKFECFEQDPIWGAMSLVFMFLPGLGVWFFWWGKDRNKGFKGLTCLAVPFFPFVLICVKVISLLNPGPNWKILAERFAVLEGKFESGMQFYLQLFIVFTRADRLPSNVQLVTIVTSLLMLTKVDIDNILMKQPPLEAWWRRWLRVASLVPKALATTIFVTSLWAVLATLLRYWVLIAGFVILFSVMCCADRVILPKLINWDIDYPRLNVGLVQMNVKDILVGMRFRMQWTVLLLLLTGLVIAANISPDLNMPGLFWQEHSLSELAIVEDINLLNAMYVLTLSTFVISCLLFYIEEWRPYKKAT